MADDEELVAPLLGMALDQSAHEGAIFHGLGFYRDTIAPHGLATVDKMIERGLIEEIKVYALTEAGLALRNKMLGELR